MNERDIFEAVSDFDEARLASPAKKARGAFRGRKWLTAIAVCLAVLVVAGSAFGAAAKLGWIDLYKKTEVLYNGQQEEVIKFDVNLTARVDASEFSDELKAAVIDPEAAFPASRIWGAYEAGKFFDQVTFDTRAEAVEFVGVEGVKNFEGFGARESDNPTCVMAEMKDGEIAMAEISTDYKTGRSNIWGVTIHTEIYTDAVSKEQVSHSGFDAEHWEGETVTAASGAQGAKVINQSINTPNGTHNEYIVVVPDGGIVYGLYLWANAGAEDAVEALINSWLEML